MQVIHPAAYNAKDRAFLARRTDADAFARECRKNGERVRVVERSVRALGCEALVWCVVRVG
jgi:hypothetical protein